MSLKQIAYLFAFRTEKNNCSFFITQEFTQNRTVISSIVPKAFCALVLYVILIKKYFPSRMHK